MSGVECLSKTNRDVHHKLYPRDTLNIYYWTKFLKR